MKKLSQDSAQKMIELRASGGLKLREIGDLFGVTRERVRQLIGNTGRKVHGDYVRKMVALMTHKEMLSATSDNPLFGSSPETWRRIIGKYHHAAKSGPVALGQKWERIVSGKLLELGIKTKLMPLGSPFDLLVEESKMRIDVKYCSRPRPTSKCVSPQWGFGIKGNQNKADFYICVAGEIENCFVIPSHLVSSKTNRLQFCWPTLRPELSKWKQFHNAFDQIS